MTNPTNILWSSHDYGAYEIIMMLQFPSVHYFAVDEGEGDGVAVGGVDEVGEAFGGGEEEAGGLAGGDGVAEGGQRQYLLGGDDGGVAAPTLLQQGGSLHHLYHVEVVTGGGAVGAEGDAGTGIEEFEHREAVAAAELEVAVGAVDASDAVVADEAYLLVGEVEAVGGDDVFP